MGGHWPQGFSQSLWPQSTSEPLSLLRRCWTHRRMCAQRLLCDKSSRDLLWREPSQTESPQPLLCLPLAYRNFSP